MKHLRDSVGADHLWFADDVFGLNRHWVTELADAVEQRGACVAFKIQSRVNLITAETANALRRAGCTEVWLGVESGSQKVLDAMEKGTCVEQIQLAREHLRRHGIRACYFLQLGYPGETWDDLRETIELVRRTHPDDIGVSVSYPLPRTKFYERVREELGDKRNWVDSDDLSIMFNGAYTNEFYRTLRDALHAEVQTWSQSEGGTNFIIKSESSANPPTSTTVADLWEQVNQMEKVCRNPEPSCAILEGSLNN